MKMIQSRLRDGSRRVPAVILIAGLIILAPAGCSRAKAKPDLECTLLELRPNPVSGYFDAIVRLDKVTIEDPLKARFQALTPTAAFNVGDLKFSVEGPDSARLDPGDTFVIPLNRPDWRLALAEDSSTYCSQNFWDRLPPDSQWHPTKSEAMDVAQSLEVVNENGTLKPVPPSLPSAEWGLTEEKPSDTDSRVMTALYQKKRADRVVEEVAVQYTVLTDAEQIEIQTASPVDFLSKVSDCVKTAGRSVTIADHAAIACDLEGVGEFGWTYRYFYFSSNLLIAVDVQSDPQEWGKSEEDKARERRTDRIFLRYTFGPYGPEDWMALVELRMDRTGAFHKRSKAGETVDKDFTLTDGEFAEIEAALKVNKFMDLESRSGLPGGTASSLSVRWENQARTVEMKNYKEPLFENIVQTIRRIVLPKAGENGR
jgi:hypothetical protein